MVIAFLLVLLGFVALILGANWMVEGASALARRHNVPDLVIGLTIVAFGTSMPELVVNIIASLDGYSDIILANIVGSNNFNLFIILGISGIILPITVKSSTAWKEIPIAIFISVFLILLLNNFWLSLQSQLSRWDGISMLALFFLFLYYVFLQLKKEPISPKQHLHHSLFKTWFLILIGLGGLIVGGQLVVNKSVAIANHFGMSEKMIGLTILAAGTSLPELVTSIVAALKKNSDIAIGNVIGSNIFNILLVLSLSSILHPITYHPKFNIDFYILIGGSLFLLIAMLTGKRKKLDRWEASLLVGFYLTYTILLVAKEI